VTRVALSLMVVLTSGLVAAAALAATSTSRATTDLDIGLARVNLSQQAVNVGVPFEVKILAGNSGAVDAHAGVVLTVPPGLRVAAGSSAGCPIGRGRLDCGDGVIPAGADGDLGSVGLVADASGSHTLQAEFVRLDVDDANLSNNSASLAITAVAAAPSLKASGFALAPARPKAGTKFRASMALLDANGIRVVPSSVTCSARVGGAAVPAKPSVGAGRATCTFSPAKGAKGKTLRGSIVATAKGVHVSKAFSVLLG
jgi:hypothetical protein